MQNIKGSNHFNYKVSCDQGVLKRITGHIFKPYYVGSRRNFKTGMYDVILRKPKNPDPTTQQRLRDRLKAKTLDFQADFTDEIKFFYEQEV